MIGNIIYRVHKIKERGDTDVYTGLDPQHEPCREYPGTVYMLIAKFGKIYLDLEINTEVDLEEIGSY
uniref:Uncharacterized protein n=1 Tax=Oryza sativa subsp. japonica TaxID=39947 RepID=Q5VNP8_ORYSJ|nr:hypothetical protein [Oryza sativa Japonica Group]